MEHTVYLVLAVAGTTILVLQVILQVFGLGSDMEAEMDADHGDPGHHGDLGHGNWFLAVLSFKAFCAFAAVFGLTGLALEQTALRMPGRLAAATGAGFGAMVVVGLLMRGLSKLSASGTVEPRNAVGRSAQVYLTVPAARSGAGKVTVEIQGRSMQFSAVTDGGAIQTGAQVTVVEVVGAETLKVTPV